MAHVRTHAVHGRAWPVMLAVALVLGIVLSSFALGAGGGGGSRAYGATVGAGAGKALAAPPISPTKIQAHWPSTLPVRSAQERQAEERALALRSQLKAAAVGPIYHPTAADMQNPGPPLPDPQTAPHADSDFDVEQTSVLPPSAICQTDCSTYAPPFLGVANDGKAIMETGVFFAARSVDNGATWSALDPATIAGGQGYFCDQQVLYEPSRDRMFWSLSEVSGVSSPNNHLTIANSPGTDLTNWCVYTLYPSAFGLPTGSWFVEPTIEYSANFLYVTGWVFDSNNPGGAHLNATVVRFPLSPSAACAGSVTPQYVSRTDTWQFNLAQGATDTMTSTPTHTSAAASLTATTCGSSSGRRARAATPTRTRPSTPSASSLRTLPAPARMGWCRTGASV